MQKSMRTTLAVLLVAGTLVPAAAWAAGRRAQGVWLPVRDGVRVQVPDAAAVYVVDRGTLRHVTLGAHRALWPSFSGIIEIESLPEGSLGAPLDEKTRLVQAPGHAEVWLLDKGATVRRHVVCPHVLESKWGFTWAKVREMPIAEVEALPVGEPVE